MEIYLDQTLKTIALAAPIAPTLGHQQNAAALQAFAGTAASAFRTNPDRLSRNLSLTAAGSRRFPLRSNRGDDGLRELDRIGCPYCRRRTYLVRVQPLGNLLSLNGRCTTCGTKWKVVNGTIATIEIINRSGGVWTSAI